VWVPSVVVDVVDTVAAGDAFCGVLAASLGERRSLDAAVRRAAAAGAHATTIPGALPSLPTRADVDRLLADDA
jgi:ribokinase